MEFYTRNTPYINLLKVIENLTMLYIGMTFTGWLYSFISIVLSDVVLNFVNTLLLEYFISTLQFLTN
jgi:hypothetical protein